MLVGIGFYAAAILLAMLSASLTMWGAHIEARLPSRGAVSVALKFRSGHVPSEEALRRAALARGYEIASGSFSVRHESGCTEWQFVAVSLGRKRGEPLTVLASELARMEGVESFHISHARN